MNKRTTSAITAQLGCLRRESNKVVKDNSHHNNIYIVLTVFMCVLLTETNIKRFASTCLALQRLIYVN